ncbi:hypothetical protein WBK31_34325 [Nonomuraea sp. N2-4H]|jgi:hypothetical protein|uniref:hypothetical protein n=1 Tax=Nonomuraea sp. N2-4H TaxID=3128898 RepID=UPI00325085C1
MRNTLPKVATVALTAGALLLTAVPASATTSATASAAAAQAEPFSVFDVSVKAPKKVKAGGKISYTVIAQNKGPHYADYYFLGGQFPKGIDLKKVYYRSSVKGTECELDGRALYCFIPKVVEKGEAIAMIFDVRLTKKARGTQTARLGIVSYDVQTGMEDMSKEELDRLGIPVHGYAKTVKTKVVR